MSFLDNFEDIKPQKGGPRVMDTVVRLTKTSLVFGDSVLSSAKGGDRVGVRVNASDQQLYLFRDDVGYKVQQQENGGTRYINCGKRLTDAGLQVGDYTPSTEHTGLYERAMGKTE